MKALIVGATGATGKHLVKHLLDRDVEVTAIVRSPDRLLENTGDHKNLTIVQADLLKLNDTELAKFVEGCDAIASCLGHNITFKGLFGHPRRLVTDAARRLCKVSSENNPAKKVKYVLMSTTAIRNRDLKESLPIGQRVLIALLRVLLPPHLDNEKVADFLRIKIGQDNKDIEWVAVRPYTLINDDTVSGYETLSTPEKNPIFDSRKTSRINVAHFMGELITDQDLWAKYKGKMPVIYNK